jgi:hypothetical protein
MEIVEQNPELIVSQNVEQTNFCFIFQIKFETYFGDKVFLTGNKEKLGNWDTNKAIELYTHSKIYPAWRSNPINFNNQEVSNLEYKYFKKTGTLEIWEILQGNRTINDQERSKLFDTIEYLYFLIDDEKDGTTTVNPKYEQKINSTKGIFLKSEENLIEKYNSRIYEFD